MTETTRPVFPHVAARDLEGRPVMLPDGFAGRRNIAVIAFRREQQALVDSWVPWLEGRSAADDGLRFYEIPAISTMWSPVRRFIDGGMAAAIGVPEVLRRTLTYYGNLTALTSPLGIDDRRTVWCVLVDQTGVVHAIEPGPFSEAAAGRLGTALDALASGD